MDKLTKWVVVSIFGRSSLEQAALDSNQPKGEADDRKLGSAKHIAKLTEADIEYIRQLYKGGATIYDLAKMYKREYQTMHLLIHFKSWKQVA